MTNDNQFKFHSASGSWLGVSLLSAMLTIFTVGFAYPWSLTMRQRWLAAHTTIGGKQLQFNGSGFGFLGLWIKIWFFSIITFGIYLLWVEPQVQKWITNNTSFAV